MLRVVFTRRCCCLVARVAAPWVSTLVQRHTAAIAVIREVPLQPCSGTGCTFQWAKYFTPPTGHELDHADRTAPTRQHELDHTHLPSARFRSIK